MLIFGMGLYGLFISNVPPDEAPNVDRALKGSSLFGMFSLKVLFIAFEQGLTVSILSKFWVPAYPFILFSKAIKCCCDARY